MIKVAAQNRASIPTAEPVPTTILTTTRWNWLLYMLLQSVSVSLCLEPSWGLQYAANSTLSLSQAPAYARCLNRRDLSILYLFELPEDMTSARRHIGARICITSFGTSSRWATHLTISLAKSISAILYTDCYCCKGKYIVACLYIHVSMYNQPHEYISTRHIIHIWLLFCLYQSYYVCLCLSVYDTYAHYFEHFLSRNVAITIEIVHTECPFQLLLQFATRSSR